MNKDTGGQHGVQSLEIGISILRAITQGHRSMMLKDIALSAEMPVAEGASIYGEPSSLRTRVSSPDDITLLLKRGNTESGRPLIISNRFKQFF